MHRRNHPITKAVVIVIALCLPALSGCSRHSTVMHAPQAGPPPSLPPDTVVLSPGQLDAIRTGTASNYAFHIDIDAMGSIGFDEAPAVIETESDLIRAAAAYKLADRELARVRALQARNGGLSQRDMERAISRQQSAEAAFKAAWYAVRIHGKSEAEIARIVATGRLDAVSTSGKASKWVVAHVLEGDSTLLHLGQPVKVRVLAYPDRIFEGKVSKIDTTVDPQTHRVTVRAKIADASHQLRPGMLADIGIQVHAPVASVAIPADGVVREGDGTMTAWTTTDGHHFEQRVIKTGLREHGEVQILAGLQRGERVVTDGAIFLDNMLQTQSSP